MSNRRLTPELLKLVERIGWKKAAKRFSRVVSTIRQWVKKGVPAKSVKEVVKRWTLSERSARAQRIAQTRKELGVTKFKTLLEVDAFLGIDPGQTRERFIDRERFWFDQKGIEIAKYQEIYRDKNDNVMMIDVEGVVWRAYTVNDKLFWTQATYLEGYATAAEMVEVYETLQGYSVKISFPI